MELKNVLPAAVALGLTSIAAKSVEAGELKISNNGKAIQVELREVQGVMQTGLGLLTENLGTLREDTQGPFKYPDYVKKTVQDCAGQEPIYPGRAVEVEKKEECVSFVARGTEAGKEKILWLFDQNPGRNLIKKQENRIPTVELAYFSGEKEGSPTCWQDFNASMGYEVAVLHIAKFNSSGYPYTYENQTVRVELARHYCPEQSANTEHPHTFATTVVVEMEKYKGKEDGAHLKQTNWSHWTLYPEVTTEYNDTATYAYDGTLYGWSMAKEGKNVGTKGNKRISSGTVQNESLKQTIPEFAEDQLEEVRTVLDIYEEVTKKKP